MDEVQVALAGYGRFGSRHASVIGDHPRARLVGVVDPSADARARAGAEHPDAAVDADVGELLDEVGPDCLLVVSTEDTHAGITRDALTRGVHVFCEKPLATTAAEARDLRALARDRDLVYQAGYILRYEPRHALLQDHIAAGSLGDIVRIRTKRNISRTWFEEYGDRIHPCYETTIHDIDLAVWLTGRRCRRVHAWERRALGRDTPETFEAVAEFSGGTIALFETLWLIPSGAPVNIVGWGEGGGEGDGVIEADLEVAGTAASASLRTYEPSLTISTEERTYVPDTSFWPTIGGRVGGALREELWDFVARVAGDDGLEVASIEDAVHVQEIAEAAVESAATGEPVELGS